MAEKLAITQQTEGCLRQMLGRGATGVGRFVCGYSDYCEMEAYVPEQTNPADTTRDSRYREFTCCVPLPTRPEQPSPGNYDPFHHMET